MAVTYTIQINAVRTHALGNLTDVVKQIDFTVVGTADSQTFALPQTLTVPDADAENFVPFAELTETQVVQWVEQHFEKMESVKAHIEYVLTKELEKSQLNRPNLPWAPSTPPALSPSPVI